MTSDHVLSEEKLTWQSIENAVVAGSHGERSVVYDLLPVNSIVAMADIQNLQMHALTYRIRFWVLACDELGLNSVAAQHLVKIFTR